MTTATAHLREKMDQEVTTEPGISHGDMVAVLAKSGSEIADDLNADLEKGNALLGSARDLIMAGNDLDLVKKWAVYNKQPDGMTLPSSEGEFIDITNEQAHLLHMAVGIAGEAAELLEAVVNHIDGAPLDVANCVEESGDIDFYHEGFRQGLGISREMILEENISKLSKRYNGLKYSNEAAQNRADKA